MNHIFPAVGILIAASLSGCFGAGASGTAELQKTTALGTESAIVAWANFTERNGDLEIRLTVTGLTAGEHGVHIHVNGDCGATPPSETAPTGTPGGKAGGHFNPDNKTHGQHAGDLGNIVVDANGGGTMSITKPALNLQTGDARSVLGRSIVVHANRDDGMTDPSGNSGGRALCGVIRAL